MTASRISPTPARKRPRARRGFSLVEVVMASMLLAIIASAIVGGITTVISADARNQQKLESLELANRLLLQYLDDKDAMPNQEAHVFQGRGVYRWAMHTSPVAIEMPPGSVIEKPAEGPGSKTIDKLTLLSVSVYAGVPDGMGGYTHGERVCTLTRVYHPLSVIYRNPDMMKRLAADPARMMELMMALIDSGTTSRTDPGAARPGARPGESAGREGRQQPAPAADSGGPAPKPAGSGAIFNGARTVHE
ncbi:MAG TPA: type II secretion system protein [Phycisphaerales bacterium]|nr:type II secretion system protein [Phycisphaerales bacterium]